MFLPFGNSEFWAFFNSNGQGQSKIFEGCKDKLIISANSEQVDWKALDAFIQKWSNDFIVCALSYELKQDIEDLNVIQDPSEKLFPKLLLIVPEQCGEVEDKSFVVDWGNPKMPSDVLLHRSLFGMLPERSKNLIKARFSEKEYCKRANKLIQAIKQGDIYEVNFCQEFFAENASINPWQVYKELNARTNAPYSTCFKYEDTWLLSASPELFLQKDGSKISSAPIKGTIARSQHQQEDLDLAKTLLDSAKERAENVMIVDLVRNDLSKIAKRGSVRVEELCAIKSFKTVHHMVSTISAVLEEKCSFSEIIKATFPMGSMTGAPKISAMNLAAETEGVERGIYSGAVGYIKPGGDFTLNVVIRSIVFDSAKKYLSFHTGSALTAACIPEYEYKECLLKAKALIESLNGTLDNEA